MPTPEAIRAAVEAYVDASNRNDRDAVLAMFAEDTEWFDPVGRPPHVGRAGVAAFFDQSRTMADTIEMRCHDIIACVFLKFGRWSRLALSAATPASTPVVMTIPI